MASTHLAHDVPAGVGQTALGVACARAEETRRRDRLFDDPYAAWFLEAAGAPSDSSAGDLAASLHWTGAVRPGLTREDFAAFMEMVRSHVVVRTRFFDDYLRAAVTDDLRQVVVLAAGLDARAYRLDWPPGTRVYELDLPEMLAFKDRVLTSRRAVAGCRRITVPADLARDWPSRLLDAGMRPDEPTAWLVEGLLVYLAPDEADRLLTAVGRLSAPGSRLSFEYGTDLEMLAGEARSAPFLSRFAPLWKGGLAEPPPDWLRRHGWRVRTHTRLALAAAYGRPVADDIGDGFVVAAIPDGRTPAPTASTARPAA